ncbi:MAG TPA: PPC domain-containing protein [Gemmatimonadales bacterium]|nr:PPC domain-containing protein [Gemmatimonadales bacterium]
MVPIQRHSRTRAHLALLTLLAIWGGSCTAPTDTSADYFVTISGTSPLLYRGTVKYLAATVWHRVGADSVQVPNAVVSWYAFPDSVATVLPLPGGYAQVTGVNRGTIEVGADAPAFGNAGTGYLSMRVADPVELDSVRPDTISWGGRITLYGVRVGSPNDVSVRINGTDLIPDPLSLVGSDSGIASMSYFVPPGVDTGQVVVTGFGLIAQGDTIRVAQHDLYEPNDTAPATIDLDAPGPYPAHPEVSLYDPALAFEQPGPTDSITTDWYRFTTVATARPWTLVLYSAGIPHRALFSAAPATLTGGVPQVLAGGFGVDFDRGNLLSRCRGQDVEFGFGNYADSIALSVQSLPTGAIDLLEYTSNGGTYGLAAYAGYRAPAPTIAGEPPIAPDRFEDNDFCEQADSNFNDPARRIDLGVRNFSDTLTIDTPFEVDWYRFRVQATESVTVATAALTALGYPDADIDVYLYRADNLALMGSSTGGTASEVVSQQLSANDYYVVVVDAGGEPTEYGLCIVAAAACTPPGGSAPARVGRRRSAPKRLMALPRRRR